MEEQITALAERYMVLTNRDHHKDRDCHFSIEKTWSYGEAPVYRVVHDGYISEWDGPKSFHSSAAAHLALWQFLTRIVAEEEAIDY